MNLRLIYNALTHRVENLATLLHEDSALTAVEVSLVLHREGETARCRMALARSERNGYRLTITRDGGGVLYRGRLSDFYAHSERAA